MRFYFFGRWHSFGDRTLGIWWVRVFGFGVAVYAPWKIPFFSERYGYRRMLRLGRWRVEWLPRWS